MLLFPPQLIIEHSFDSVEKRITKRELDRKRSPATLWRGEHRPLDHDPQLL